MDPSNVRRVEHAPQPEKEAQFVQKMINKGIGK
jgi:hypothetical protein